MKRTGLILSVALFASVGLSGCPGGACLGIDTCQVQGKWVARIFILEVTMTCDGDNVVTETSMWGETMTESGKFKLNPWRRPKEIDMELSSGDGSKPQVTRGIYEITPDMFRLEFGTEGERPREFTTDSFVFLRVE